MVDLSVDFLGHRLPNPTVLASGILGVTKASLALCAQNGAAAVTLKSVTRESRKGHPLPIACGFEGGLLNAVGYSGPGYVGGLDEFDGVEEIDGMVIGSIVAGDADEYAFLATEFVNKLSFDAFEIPLSCPHTPGFGELAGHSTPEATTEIVAKLKSVTDVPLIVKLSANVSNIAMVARAAQDAGADAICAVNTLGPGMLLDGKSSKPILGYGSGGISGPALAPVALLAVHEIYEQVDIPIVGTGGIATGRDAVAMLQAGATLLGIGTAVVTRGIGVFATVCRELEDALRSMGHENLADIRGKSHEK